MGERKSLTWVIIGLLALALLGGAAAWGAQWLTTAEPAETYLTDPGTAPGEYVAHLYAVAENPHPDAWTLDGDKCKATWAVGREIATAPALTLPFVADWGMSGHAYQFRSAGRLSVQAPEGTRIGGEAVLVSSNRSGSWPTPGRPEAAQDVELGWALFREEPARNGRAVLDLDDVTRLRLPWDDGIHGARRQVDLSVWVGPMARCDRLRLSWDKAYSGDVLTLESVSSHPVDPERQLPPCVHHDYVLTYIGDGVDLFDYACQPDDDGGGRAHLTFAGYSVDQTLVSNANPIARGEIRPSSANKTQVQYATGDAANAANIAVGDRIRITQATGTSPDFYEGNVTAIARASDDVYGYTFDGVDAIGSPGTCAVGQVSLAGLQCLAGTSDYEIIRVGSGLDYVRAVSPPFSGTGKPGHPLDLSEATTTAKGAMSAADKTKLDGIPTGPLLNPRHVALPFRTEDGSNANNAGVVKFIDASNNQWQNGSSALIAAIEINPTQNNLSQNPQTDTATYSGWHSVADDLKENGGSSIWTFRRISETPPLSTIPGELFHVQADSLIVNNDGNYVLGMLNHLTEFSASGSGYNWEVVAAFAPPTGADAVIGVLPKTALPGDVVYEGELAGHESDVYFSYTNAANEYWPGTIKFYNQSSGAPANANLVRQPDIAAGTITVAVGTPRTDRDPNDFELGTAYQATDFVSGDVYYLRDWNAAETGGTLTLTSGGTVLGTGNARRVYFTATLALSGTDLPDVEDQGDYWVFAEEEPTHLQIEIPYTDVDGLGSAYVRTDGSNVNDTLVNRIQGDNETVTLSNTYTIADTNQKYYIQLTTTNNLNTARIRLPNTAVGSQDDLDLTRLIKDRAWVDINGYVIDVTSNATRSLIGTSLTFAFNYEVVAGTKPASGTSQPDVFGEDVHRGELARQAFANETPSIAGKGGSAGQVWTRGSGESNAGWAAPPITHGTALPGSCVAPALFALTALSGSNAAGLYVCLAANTWTGVGP